MAEHRQFALQLDRRERFEFETTFDWPGVSPLLLDEPEPIGGAKGPNASRLVGAAVGNCLSASLLFCIDKAKQAVKHLHTDVVGTMTRNEKGRMRIGKLDVRITLDVEGDKPERVSRCFQLFEDYCVVTGSVRKGIPVSVVVVDPSGKELYRRDDAESTSA
jgi:uncharacterized OsmC-like protein